MVIYEKRQQWRQIEARTSVVKTGWLVAMTAIIACSQKEGKEEEGTTRTPEVSSGKREKPGSHRCQSQTNDNMHPPWEGFMEQNGKQVFCVKRL